MLITIYISNYGEDVLNEKDFDKLVKERVEDILDDTGLFEEYLADHYTHVELFEMRDNKERAELLENWEKRAIEMAKDDLEYDGWNEKTLEV